MNATLPQVREEARWGREAAQSTVRAKGALLSYGAEGTSPALRGYPSIMAGCGRAAKIGASGRGDYRGMAVPRELRWSKIRTGQPAPRKTFSAMLAPNIRSSYACLRPPITTSPASISLPRRTISSSDLPSL